MKALRPLIMLSTKLFWCLYLCNWNKMLTNYTRTHLFNAAFSCTGTEFRINKIHAQGTNECPQMRNNWLVVKRVRRTAHWEMKGIKWIVDVSCDSSTSLSRAGSRFASSGQPSDFRNEVSTSVIEVSDSMFTL